MKSNNIFNFIHINEYSATPKYMQLVNSIMNAVADGNIKKNILLPSLNELSSELEVSRDTIEKGYKYLKETGVLVSIPGKGYYINDVNLKPKLKVFLLFNKLSAHKKIVYDAFVASLGNIAAIDFHIYNNDFSLFKKLLDTAINNYSHYVILPHFSEGGENAHTVINTIPKNKLILLDKQIEGVNGKYGAVYQNFEKDIYTALKQAIKPLSKYHTLKLIFPKNSSFPNEIITGLYNFCQQYAFTAKLVNNISTEPIQQGEVYINLVEDDLVILVERILALNLIVGKEVGIISYNETPLKKIILNGITTVSTDFNKMGQFAAELILNKSLKQIEVPFYLTLRESL